MLDKRYNSLDAEKEMQELWEQNQTFKFDENNKKELFSMDTPPPTVSGKLHIGHVFSYTQAEMVMRYKKLNGFNVYYPFGYDDNGLPTERLVEKEEGILAKDLPRSEFIKKCNNTTEKYIGEFRDLWKSLGFSVDWDLQYDTINELSRRVSQKSFIELAKKGYAYQKEMPVLWCPNCQTSIAQAELDNKEKDSYFNYINFECEGQKLEIATTRPEYLGACVAIFVHPEDDRFKHLIGKKAIVPLYGNKVTIIGDAKVAIDKGTGVVMCCTYGDITDMEWQKEYDLPYVKLMGPDGIVDSSIKFVGGMPILDARMKIVEELQNHNLLVRSEKLTHNVNVHERCGNDIEIIPSKQWYIDVLNIKDRLLKAADDINWYPEQMKNRYLEWVNNLKWDWCISRQRYFGVPFPVWYCADCGEIIFAEDKDLPVNPLEENALYKKCPKCGSDKIIPESAVMDTWATSSVTPFINMKYGEKDQKDYLYPMTVRSQAHEIIRTWTFYSIVKGLYHFNKVPWRDLMISGFVLAKKGEKISKSKDNASSSPSQLIAKYGADMIRYWAACNRLGTDTWFVEEDIESSRRFITKLWNASKFAIIHLEDYKKDDDIKLHNIDKWIISRCQDAKNRYQTYMNKYELGLARQEIDKFFWNDICDNYLEIIKDRLYKPEVHGVEARKSAQQALYYVLLETLKMYSPIVPHITEFIYQNFFKKFENVNTISENCFIEKPLDKKLLTYGDQVKEIISEIRKYKTDNDMSMKEELGNVDIESSKEIITLLEGDLLDMQVCNSAKSIKLIEADKTKVTISNN